MQLPANSSEEKDSLSSLQTQEVRSNTRPSDLPSPPGDALADVAIATTSRQATWLSALTDILPVYIATHIAFLLLTYLATLFAFTPKNFSLYSLPLSTLVQSWNRWDSNHFVEIATKGYDVPYRTAFFPLFPLLERGLAFLTHDPFVAISTKWPLSQRSQDFIKVERGKEYSEKFLGVKANKVAR